MITHPPNSPTSLNNNNINGDGNGDANGEDNKCLIALRDIIFNKCLETKPNANISSIKTQVIFITV